MKRWSGSPVQLQLSFTTDMRGMMLQISSGQKALSRPEWIEVMECYVEWLKEEYHSEIAEFKELEDSGKLVRLGNKPREKL